MRHKFIYTVQPLSDSIWRWTKLLYSHLNKPVCSSLLSHHYFPPSVCYCTCYMHIRCVGIFLPLRKHKKSSLRKAFNRNQYKYDSVAHPVWSSPTALHDVSASVTCWRTLKPVDSLNVAIEGKKAFSALWHMRLRLTSVNLTTFVICEGYNTCVE